MACDDRQLTQQQRAAGFQQQRTGVQRALRPFTGSATLPNLLDYINRELVPALRQSRDAVNDIYLQVADNAPTANPLAFYFSAETGAADPTPGRIRLNASPQDTATVVRINELNARLNDVVPWLDVMAGSSTTPLGVITMSDSVNPGRFVRFDLNTMTDNGSYWDLGVSPIEASHPDPFVDGEAVVVAFIPGVASTGTTVPVGALTPITAESVLGNPTSSTAAPVAIPLNDLSVLGRAGVLGTHVAGIDVPGTGTFTGESVFLRVASTRLGIQWRNWTLVDMPTIGDLKFVGNVSGATARPAYTDLAQLGQDLFGIGFDTATHNFKLTSILTDHFLANITGATTTPIPTPLSDIDSTSLVYDGTTHTFQRAALTGDVTSAQNSNTVTVNTSAITNAKLADMVAGTVKGRQIDAATGAPVDLTGLEVAELIRFGTTQSATLAATTNDFALNADATVLRLTSTTGAQSLTGITGGVQGRLLFVENISAAGNTISLTSLDAGSLTANRIRTPNALPVALRFRETAILRWETNNGDWRVVATGRATVVEDRDFGDITVSGGSLVWTIDNDVVTNAKLADMAQSTIKGRAESAGTGDPTDLTPTQVAAIIDGEAITWSALQSFSGGLNFSGTIQTETAAASMDITLAAGTVRLLIESSGTNFTVNSLSGAATAGRLVILEHTRLSGSAVGTIAHASGTAPANSAFNCPDSSNYLLGQRHATILVSRSGVWRVVGTAGIADGTITLAKMANLAAGTVIGRQIDAGTGVPVALTGTELGENLRIDTRVDDASTSGTSSPYTPVAADTNWIRFTALTGAYTLNGVDNNTSGRMFLWTVEPGTTGTLVFTHNSGLVSTGFRFFCPGAVDLTIGPGDCVWTIFTSNRHRVVSVTRRGFALTDADKGDITVSASGATWTIDNDVVSDAKLRNSGALSVIGRSANSTGDPADISAVAASDSVLRESGSTLGFGTIATGGLANNAVTDAKLRQGGALSVIGRSANSTGNVADIAGTASSDQVLRVSGTTLGFGTVATAGIANNAVTNAKIRQGAALTVIGVAGNATADVADIGAGSDGFVLRRSGTALGFGTIATAGIGDDQVTDAKLRNSGALSVIGRSANSSGDPADISAVAASGSVLRESGSTVGFGTIATAGITDDAVTNAKLANMAQSTLKGRAAGAGTGDPTDLDLDTTVQRCIQISYNATGVIGASQSVPTGATWFKVKMRAGGGGSGGADAETNGEVSAGGGGGEGAYLEVWYPVVSGSITAITIGAGGLQGTNAGTSGSNGTASTFTYNGETYNCLPGQGGTGCAAGAGAGMGATVNMKGFFGGIGGSHSSAGAGHIFYLALAGQAGQPAMMYGSGTTVANAIAIGGNGGGVNGARGAMVQGGAGTGNGVSATSGTGGGGSGGARIVAATGAATGATGGSGADGHMVIEFYSGPLPVADGL